MRLDRFQIAASMMDMQNSETFAMQSLAVRRSCSFSTTQIGSVVKMDIVSAHACSTALQSKVQSSKSSVSLRTD